MSFIFTKCFVTPGDDEIEVFFTADDDGNVRMSKDDIAGITDLIGSDELDRQFETIQDWWVDTGWNEALEDRANDHGDYLYERTRE